jgi:hypothetical protein
MGFFDRLRTRRARERYMPLPRRIRSGTTALIAMAVIAVTLAISLVLDWRSDPGNEAVLAWVEANATDPIRLIDRATRSRTVLLLGDVIGAAGPKRLAATLIDTLGLAGRLEAVALEVPADQQAWIDLYLETDPEDASVLLTHPRTIRESEGVEQSLLAIYRAVWRVNQVLGANRRIRIIAADPAEWPPAPGFSPARALTTFAQRDSVMHAILRTRILDRNPRARILVFVDGLHVINADARAAGGGIAPVEIRFLAARLADSGVPAYSVLVDASRGAGANPPVAGYRAGPLHGLVRGRLAIPQNGIALPIAGSNLGTNWLASPERPGLDFQVLFPAPTLEGRIDAWVFLN